MTADGESRTACSIPLLISTGLPESTLMTFTFQPSSEAILPAIRAGVGSQPVVLQLTMSTLTFSGSGLPSGVIDGRPIPSWNFAKSFFASSTPADPPPPSSLLLLLEPPPPLLVLLEPPPQALRPTTRASNAPRTK